MHQNKSGILLSGGMDSISIAYWKRPAFSFTIDYGQKPAQAEIHAAQNVSKQLGIEHHIINVDCSELGTGDLSSNKSLSISPMKEWWPFRNQLLITLACMKGIVLGMEELYVGSVKTDEAHSDGTLSFYNSASQLVEMQEGSITIQVPAIEMTTTELIGISHVPLDLLLWAHSCHTSNSPCMHCNGCLKYLHTLQAIGVDK